ncbi:MAG TPA: hypothetical protein VFB58_08925 [Chloroflexota bacterium]|nr:hypothetical protein [Chloroflexota bacterium]
MEESLARAVHALRRCVEEVQAAPTQDAIRRRLRVGAEEILEHLEAADEPEDLWSSLDRQSKDIAEDLRRAERLMRERSGGV